MTFALSKISQWSSGPVKSFQHQSLQHLWSISSLLIGQLGTVSDSGHEERLEQRKRRLSQIKDLPLKQMSRCCRRIPLLRDKVSCLLCQPYAEDDHEPVTSYTKEEWAVFHLRFAHWNFYFVISSTSWPIPKYLVAQEVIQRLPMDDTFSLEGWILLEDLTTGQPIITDDEICNYALRASTEKPGGVFRVDLHLPWKYRCCALSVPPGRKNDGEKMHEPIQGPVFIRRFVVVREGKWGCLCLGIHT